MFQANSWHASSLENIVNSTFSANKNQNIFYAHRFSLDSMQIATLKIFTGVSYKWLSFNHNTCFLN